MVKKKLVVGIVLIMCACTWMLSACKPKPKNIAATAMFSKNTLELPILGIPDGPGYFYGVKLSIDEISSKISDNESFSTTNIDGKIFIVKDNNDGTKDYFIIREAYGVGGNGYYYQFFDMGEQTKLSNDFGQRLLIPYHLITEENHVFDSYIEMNTEYRTKFGVDDFFDFYNNSGWYDVEKGEDYFIIKGYIDEEKVTQLNNALQNPLKGINFTLPIKYQFISSEEPNINLFVVSYL